MATPKYSTFVEEEEDGELLMPPVLILNEAEGEFLPVDPTNASNIADIGIVDHIGEDDATAPLTDTPPKRAAALVSSRQIASAEPSETSPCVTVSNVYIPRASSQHQGDADHEGLQVRLTP